VRSVRRVLDEEPMPLRIVRNYPPYREIADPREGRAAIVELRLSGWSAKAIASYLEVHKATVYRALNRWKDEGFEGLADRSPGRPPGVRKADFAAVEAIRKLAKNPGLGAFRVHAALLQMGFDLSRATCGRILAQVRELYGYEKPPGRGRTAAGDAVRRLRAPRGLERRRQAPGHGRRGPRRLEGVLGDRH
jgi:putative transposase